MKKYLFILPMLFGMFACDDIFEKDLTDKTVAVVAPSDGLTVEPGEVIFAWQGVEGARSYHLRIVGGEFAGHSRAVVDTLMHDDTTGVKRSYTRMLDEGDYQWSITALNDEYRTVEVPRTLHVVGAKPAEMSREPVEITAPANGTELEAGEIAFSWTEVAGAEFYRFTLVSPSFSNAAQVLAEVRLPVDGDEPCNIVRYEINKAGGYQWRVVAGNSTHETEAAVSSFFVSAITEPGPADISGKTVKIIAPHDGAELDPGEVTFLWREVEGADSYHITIVGPSFDEAEFVIADEETTERSLRINNIPVGRYQWSLQAKNDKYKTAEQVFSFEVVEPEPEEPEMP